MNQIRMLVATLARPRALHQLECQSMSNSTVIRRTFKYRLYGNRRNQRLHQRIDVAGIIWNHMIALQRRYYRLSGKYISRPDRQRHLLKLRRRSPKYSYWQRLGSQADRSWPSATIKPTGFLCLWRPSVPLSERHFHCLESGQRPFS
jgi:hypothetical protein